MKNIFITLVLFAGLSSCSSSENDEKTVGENSYFQITGQAQGTSYSIIYQDSMGRDFSMEIDSLLDNYDSYLSIYKDSSLISRFNRTDWSPGCAKMDWNYSFNDRTELLKSPFANCFEKAKEVYSQTDGAFNPTVYPLVKYWGFYNEGADKDSISDFAIDSLLQLVKFDDSSVWMYIDQIKEDEVVIGSSYVVCKRNGLAQLDFNAIAQGHSIDVIGDYFSGKGISNFMIELGGEVLCKGSNNLGEIWRIGIDKPVENSSPGSEGFQIVAMVENKALATSGNYRKFYEKDGVKFSHTINPLTGKPVDHTLLSATVIANECSLADGYATAFMVMGVEKTKEFIQKHKELQLEAYLVFSNENDEWETWMSDGFSSLIVSK